MTTLRSKRDEITAAIVNYEKRLAQARADLSHINAAIAIFEASGDRETMPPYVDIHRIFKHGEIGVICKRALADGGPLDTRAIPTRHARQRAGRRRQRAPQINCVSDCAIPAPSMETREDRYEGKAARR